LLLIVALTLGWVLGTVNVARAQTPDPADQVHDIAKQLNCPTCAGRNLADCPTDTCMQWKAEIKSQLQAGKSQQEVLDYFKARFGPTVLQEPPKEGAVLVLWVLPVIGLLVLAVGGIIVLRRVSAQRAQPGDSVSVQSAGLAGASAQPADEYVARLEEEVRKS
jgi:cytochrome c-type biogenesis protein CcmH